MSIKDLYREIILIDDSYFTSLMTDIKSAKYSIDIEVYIFEDDLAGKELSYALCDAAKRGVKIRVLVDGVGTQTWGNEITKKMENAGILTRVFHPLPWIIKHWHYPTHPSTSILSKLIYLLSKINSRNHRKVCIIDNRIAYIGSANITEHLIKMGNISNLWRETSVKLLGIKTDELQHAFEKAWGYIPFKKRIKNAFVKFSTDPIFRLNYSWRRRHILYKSMLSRIAHCKKRIWVTNSYFVPDNYLLKKLKNASKRGIDVRILLPYKSDVFIASLASRTFYSTLLKHGVLIYEYLPTMLHAKVLIVDDWYSVGSSNLNYRSIRHDLEVDINIQTSDAKIILERQFLLDVSKSKKINSDDITRQPLYQYLLGRLTLFITYWI